MEVLEAAGAVAGDLTAAALLSAALTDHGEPSLILGALFCFSPALLPLMAYASDATGRSARADLACVVVVSSARGK